MFRGEFLALFVGVAVFLVMAALQFKVSIPLSQEDIVINQVVQLSDGSINVDLWVDDTAHSIAYEWSEEDHVLYLVPYRSFFVFEDSSWDGWQSDIPFYVLQAGETEAPDKVGMPLPPTPEPSAWGPKKGCDLGVGRGPGTSARQPGVGAAPPRRMDGFVILKSPLTSALIRS